MQFSLAFAKVLVFDRPDSQIKLIAPTFEQDIQMCSSRLFEANRFLTTNQNILGTYTIM